MYICPINPEFFWIAGGVGGILPARSEFMEKGFAETAMESVARRAGVAKGTPYRYFPTKEALFSAVVQQEIAGTLVEVDATKRAPNESIQSFLRRSMMAAIKGTEPEGRGAIARLVISEGRRFPSLVEIYRREMITPLLQQIRQLADAARASGELSDDRLSRYPHLLIAPIWVGILDNEFFDISNPLDIGALFETQLDLVFGGSGAGDKKSEITRAEN